MNRLYLFLMLVFALPYMVKGQFTDDFSDGDFALNPTWSGDVADFKINTSFQLQLNATVAGESYLSTPSSSIADAEWQFWVKQSFSSSVNNNSRVYLVSDQANLKGPLNGYFVQVGETVKNISLFRQSGTTVTKIIDGTVAVTGNSTNQIRVKVTRDTAGNWKLQTDPAGGILFVDEGLAFDNTFTTTTHFGIVCKYTVSNSTKFYYDDFYAGAIQVDSIPPQISSLRALSNIQLDVHFSEAVEQLTAENAANYSVNMGIGQPISAFQDLQNPSIVHLTFSTPFPESVVLTLTVSGIHDLANNLMAPASRTFSYYIPRSGDVIISEIMADPSPAVALPNQEYLELFNRSSFDIDLSGWKLYLGSSERLIGSLSIAANSFVLLGHTGGQAVLSPFAPYFGFSSFSLTNEGQTLILTNAQGQMIHTVSYSDTWYGSTYKKDGGWSLEIMDAANPCAGQENWTASTDATGGTPGRQNSVKTSRPDLFPPELWRIALKDEFSIEVFFNESVDSTRLLNVNSFLVTPGDRRPALCRPVSPRYESAILHFAQRFDEGVLYTLKITDTITDCVGNRMAAGASLPFGVPQRPDSADAIINEILFNPPTNGVDFVEIYNRSTKILSLSDLVIASWDFSLGQLKDIKDISTTAFLLFPGEYIVLSVNSKAVKNSYYTKNPGAFIDLPSMPAFNISDGTAVIATKDGNIIDFFSYEENMHFAMIKDVKGVSLERIHFNRPASDRSNWHSAAGSVGYATPGYLNSQYADGQTVSGKLSVEPEIFSPDNDGKDDVLLIHYEMEEAGQMATLSIFNERGMRVRLLLNNEMLAMAGTLSWDGIDDLRRKLPAGRYIIHLEVFDLKGNKSVFRTTMVLGTRLN